MAQDGTMTDDQLATQQAAAGAPGTKSEPETPARPDEFKAWCRANARWLMAELDWARAGRNHDERATLNP